MMKIELDREQERPSRLIEAPLSLGNRDVKVLSLMWNPPARIFAFSTFELALIAQYDSY
jgi:hypothetical protein